MTVRFSANLSMLFTEAPFLERFERAAAAGFRAVEFWWPAEDEPQHVARAARAAGVEAALLNFDAGDMSRGERGLASDPSRVDAFRGHVPVALGLAEAVGCRRLNLLVGLAIDGLERERQLELARENVRFAADAAAGIGAGVLIEPINALENGPYLLPTVAEALAFIATVDRDNVALQYDVYHAQRSEGNIVDTIRAHVGRIGHVQVADCPGRGEPGTGEIRFAFVLDALRMAGYDGYVGLEYRPTTQTTEESLGWMRDLG
jgi:hydroxypyruvate isomerase